MQKLIFSLLLFLCIQVHSQIVVQKIEKVTYIGSTDVSNSPSLTLLHTQTSAPYYSLILKRTNLDDLHFNFVSSFDDLKKIHLQINNLVSPNELYKSYLFFKLGIWHIKASNSGQLINLNIEGFNLLLSVDQINRLFP
jgi:hypothetical protein